MRTRTASHSGCWGFTVTEVVTSIAIAAIGIGGIVSAYALAAQQAKWSAYSLAAHSAALQRVEQVRAAKWDLLAFPPVDEAVGGNFPVQTVRLDVPASSRNPPWATNVTTITLLSSNPPLKSVQVECYWSFPPRGLFSNSLTSYRGPDS